MFNASRLASCLALHVAILSPWDACAQQTANAGTVTLPRTEYDRLVDLSIGRTVPENPPVAATLARADLLMRVDGSMVRATMSLQGEVFQTGAVTVPLITGATLLDARMDDQPLPLVFNENTHAAILTGPRTFRIVLNWAAPFEQSPGRGAVWLPVPPAGTALGTIAVPGTDSDVRVDPGTILRRDSAGGFTLLEVSLTPSKAARISWSTRNTAPSVAATRDTRFISDVKSLIGIGDAEVALTSIIDLNLLQGELNEVEILIPNGYEVASVSGSTIDRTDQTQTSLRIALTSSAERRHHIVLRLRRPATGASFQLQTAFPSLPAAQRESGEVAIEALGAVDVAVKASEGFRRLDVRELNPQLRSASRDSMTAAFRYHRGSGDTPSLALDITRFPSAEVLAAVADRAVATTLVTSGGRALTEITLWVRNQAQPYMKVALPEGASMLSAEVAGQPAKPVEGTDGTRVPLLRANFRPQEPYSVSFVYLHASEPFARKGNMQMTLPRMDLPVGLIEWELFVPENYRADRFDGNAIRAELVEARLAREDSVSPESRLAPAAIDLATLPSGTMAGVVTDVNGGAMPGVTVTVRGGGKIHTVVTGEGGKYLVNDLPSGPAIIEAQLPGFRTTRRLVIFNQTPQQADLRMEAGAMTETVTVSSGAGGGGGAGRDAVQTRNELPRNETREPSANVQALQRRAAGVLPIRFEVPRTGTSHRFIKPLLVDEETIVRFRYRRR